MCPPVKVPPSEQPPSKICEGKIAQHNLKTFIMLQISKVKTIQKHDGTSFISLVLEGGVELVQSKNTGKFYAKGKKALMPTTLSEGAAIELVGSTIPGSIQRVSCDGYDFTIKDSGEVIRLYHTYLYSPDMEDVSVITSSSDELARQAEVICMED